MKESLKLFALLLAFVLPFTAILCLASNIGYEEPTEETDDCRLDTSWDVISESTTITVYNAEPGQCNEDYLHTASMYEIHPSEIPSQRIAAMERTMMKEFGISYGDVILIEGTDEHDGLWQVQDTMNKRFKGQHRIDLLMPSDVRTGKWTNVKVSLPRDEFTKENALLSLNTY